MIICHVCKKECNDDMELCPICGAELGVAVEEKNEEANIDIMENPTLLASFEDVISAEIFKDILYLGFAPRSQSFAIEPLALVCSICSLSGLATNCVVRPQIRSSPRRLNKLQRY